MQDLHAAEPSEDTVDSSLYDAANRAWEEMGKALEDELHTLRHERHIERIDLSEGIRLPDETDQFQFRKVRPRVLPYPPGTHVALDLRGEQGSASARIISQDLETITVRLNGRDDAETPPASIFWDPAWLVESLRRQLPHAIHSRIARGLLGLVELHPHEHRKLLLPHSGLDPKQQAVIEQAISTEITRLWGPPGTGKTLVVGELIDELRAHGESVLVVAPSHLAADLVTMQVLSRIRDGGRRRIGRVVRWGTPQLPELRRLESARSVWGRRPEIEFHLGDDRDAVMRAVHHADVVITTVHKGFVSTGFERLFDSVIVDEAAMVLLPAAVVALSYARRRGIIAGDHRQLGPIVRTAGPPARRWLRRSAFEIVPVPSHEDASPPHIVTLDTQYRMHPDICGVVSDLSYGGRLRSAAGTANRVADDTGLGSGALYLIDTSSIVRGFEGRLSNPAHARVIAALIEVMRSVPTELSRGVTPHIAVLSRFRAQVAEIRRGLGSWRGDSSTIVDTVHGFQGSEADSVIVDLTASPGSRLGDYLSATSPRDDGGRLLTVALSRARGRLIVAANLEYLLATLHRDSMARRLLAMLTERGEVIPAAKVTAMLAAFRDAEGVELRVG